MYRRKLYGWNISDTALNTIPLMIAICIKKEAAILESSYWC